MGEAPPPPQEGGGGGGRLSDMHCSLDFLSLEDGVNRLSLNVSNVLPFYVA